jgi:hypothetical protein
MKGNRWRTCIQSIRQLVDEVAQPRYHVHLLSNFFHDTIPPFQDVHQLALNLGGCNVVGIKVICFRLLLHCIALVYLVVVSTYWELANNSFESTDIRFFPLRGLK